MNRREFLTTGALTTLAAAWPTSQLLARKSTQAAGKPNVLVIVLDSFSAENASLYGYPRQTTPFLDQFAASATVFHRHYAGGNFTAPATASLLTGTYPWSHRAVNIMGTVSAEYQNRQLFNLFGQADYERIALAHTPLAAVLMSQFSRDIDTLQRLENVALFHDTILSAALPMSEFDIAFPSEMQYLTGTIDAIDGQVRPGSLFLSNLHRLWRVKKREQVVAKMLELYPKGVPKAGNSIMFLIEDSIDWLLETLPKASQPYLSYFHCYAPHFPYTPRREFAEMFKDDGWQPEEKPRSRFAKGNVWGNGLSEAELRRWRLDYDQYIAFTDAEIGRLLTTLDLDNTIVVITADHGELFERGILGHVTAAMYDPLLRIPLLIRMPNQTQRVDVRTPTSAVDVLPTLLHLTDQAVPAWCEGTVLPPYGERDSQRSVFALETKRSSKRGAFGKRSVAVMQGDYKLVHYVGYEDAEDVTELYDVAVDPEERSDLSREQPELVADLVAEGMARLDEAGVLPVAQASG